MKMNNSDTGNKVIVVDLDGTLINSDLLHESMSKFLLKNPFSIIYIFFWILRGRAYLKNRIAEIIDIDISVLPYNQLTIDWIRQKKNSGHKVILATGSNEKYAQQISDHLNFFDEVLASNSKKNFTSFEKAKLLNDRFGKFGYEYLGNSKADIAVWMSAAKAHAINYSKDTGKFLQSFSRCGDLIEKNKNLLEKYEGYLKLLRPIQWLKNVLIFIPLIASHQFLDSSNLFSCLVAFIIFSLAASSIYIINDLVDIENDRHHRIKYLRPLASGSVSVVKAWIIWPCLMSFAIGYSFYFMKTSFFIIISFYCLISIAYSIWLKKYVILDILALASLYTIRVIAGSFVVNVPLSFWLIAFSVFIFTSLALVKRYNEILLIKKINNETPIKGRGYLGIDLHLISQMGICSAYISVLVLALYIQDPKTISMYTSPWIIWFTCPLLLFWLSRIWLLSHRSQLNEDPILFAAKDIVSWTVAVLFLITLLVARIY